MFTRETRLKIESELLQAEQARAQGYTGRARVCARRAAGIAAREYLNFMGIAYNDPSAVAVLELLRRAENSPAPIKMPIDYLLMRVDTDYNLPVDVDLIEQAKTLISVLEKIISGENLDHELN